MSAAVLVTAFINITMASIQIVFFQVKEYELVWLPWLMEHVVHILEHVVHTQWLVIHHTIQGICVISVLCCHKFISFLRSQNLMKTISLDKHHMVQLIWCSVYMLRITKFLRTAPTSKNPMVSFHS